MCDRKESGGLGFRDLECFNEAMLAKQGWRLLMFPGSLVARVLRAKYYPHGSFLEAAKGSRASFTWQSISEASWLLKRGIRKRIGSGEETLIYHDPWLPTYEVFKVISPVKEGWSNSTVAELRRENGSWDKEFILNNFVSRDAEAILSIPLGFSHRPDSWMWNYTRHGNFSVRSAYWLAYQNKHQLGTGTSGGIGDRKYWKFIWSLNVPPSVRVWMWRLSHEAVPARMNLSTKFDPGETICPICREEDETLLHILRDCAFARATWFASSLSGKSSFMGSNSVLEWLEELCSSLKSEQVAICAMIMHGIWKARNKYFFEGLKPCPMRAALEAEELLGDFRQAVEPSRGLHKVTTESPQWRPPTGKFVKVNVDATGSQGGFFAVSAVLRNHKGTVLGVYMEKVEGQYNIEAAEAVAIYKGLLFAIGEVHEHIIVESDCLSLVQKLASRGNDLNSIGGILEDIAEIATFPTTISFTHVRREANKVAHGLAARALLFPTVSFQFWRDFFPSFLFDVLSLDSVIPVQSL